jgi:phosphate transport system substrate-binding protein
VYRRIWLVLLLSLATPAAAETLRVGGVGAATNLLPILFSGLNQHQDTKLEVIPSLGSNGGLRALSENALDIAVIGRSLSADEIKQGMTIGAAVRTPFVLVTSHRAPNAIGKSEVADLFSAPNAHWADGTPLRVILRPKSDSDTPTWIAQFPGMATALEAARKRHDVPTAATDQDNADAAGRIDGSLAGSTLTQIITERRTLRLVPVDGVAPSVEALENGSYPFSKQLLLVLPAKKSAAAERFIASLGSPSGRALLRENGNITVDAPGGT